MLSIHLLLNFCLPLLVYGASNEAVVGSGYIRHPVSAVAGGAGGFSKRQNANVVSNQQKGTIYTIDLDIGTPAQLVTVAIDTGSSELVVNPTCANAGDTVAAQFCESLPRFNSGASSTLVDTGASNTLNYAAGEAEIEYVRDYVAVGAARLQAQIFGVASETQELSTGVMGLAPRLDSTQASYPYILDNMRGQGFINSRAFSLDLRNIESSSGSVIFGGIDTGKFIGSLQKLPIVDLRSTVGDRYWITLDAVALTTQAGTTTTVYSGPGFPVFLDSGDSLSHLPESIYRAVGASFSSSRLDAGDSGYYIVDCSDKTLGGSVDFGFGGKVIRVPFEDFIVTASDGTCVVGILPEDEQPVLGDTFLRAAYVVYDQDNRNVHLAQAAECGTNIVAIGSGIDAVPSVTGDCSASTATSTSSASSTTSTSSFSITSTTSTTVSSSLVTTYSATSSTSLASISQGETTSSAISSLSSISASSTTSAGLNQSTPTVTGVPNADPSSARPTYTSVFTETRTFTITSCAPEVTNCPANTVTTQEILKTTTWCPEESAISIQKVRISDSGSDSIIPVTLTMEVTEQSTSTKSITITSTLTVHAATASGSTILCSTCESVSSKTTIVPVASSPSVSSNTTTTVWSKSYATSVLIGQATASRGAVAGTGTGTGTASTTPSSMITVAGAGKAQVSLLIGGIVGAVAVLLM